MLKLLTVMNKFEHGADHMVLHSVLDIRQFQAVLLAKLTSVIPRHLQQDLTTLSTATMSLGGK
jgi:hypothetical protein